MYKSFTTVSQENLAFEIGVNLRIIKDKKNYTHNEHQIHRQQ